MRSIKLSFPILNIPNTEEQTFLREHQATDLTTLALHLTKRPDLRKDLILRQINGLQKIKTKIPDWVRPDLLFPVKVSLEQASSALTGAFKASLVSGKNLLDGTGGFGIDSFFFSERVEAVDYFEMNADLAAIAKHNFERLGRKNIRVHQGNSIDFLQQEESAKYDWIYLDPARRDESKRKVFLLEDCLPDVSEHQDLLLRKADNILLKLSPMADIRALSRTLRGVHTFYTVAVNNELKELLVHLSAQAVPDTPKLLAYDLTTGQRALAKGNLNDLSYSAEIGAPEAYLYEPNRAILKAGLYDKSAAAFGLKKLHPHSHFYTSPSYIEDYPGRIFSVREKLKAKAKNIKKVLDQGKANIIARNYPLKASQLYEKFKIKPGGSVYLLATTLEKNERVLFAAERLK